MGNDVRRSPVKMYVPFVAVILAQALLVGLFPSRGPDHAALSAGPLANAPLTASSADNGTETTTLDAAGTTSAPGATTPNAAGRRVGGAAGGAPTIGGGGATALRGDTSHCRNGRQTDVIFQAPPCAPKFVGDNGGATYRGVTAAQISIVDFDCKPNEQVDALLAKQGLKATEEETIAMLDAIGRFLNGRYEFYGRKVVMKRVIGNCDGGKPDEIRQAAAEVAKGAFMVLYPFGGFDAHDVWARNGVISLGSPMQELSLYTGRRPYRWDVFVDGNQTADIIAEYYCKKLASGTATHAGRVIHSSIGDRTTPRKAGVIVPDNGDNSTLPTAQRLSGLLKQCSGKDAPIFTYASDISRATEQARAIVAGMIDAKVTSVVCLCDPIAPVFLTGAMTANSYFPEHILSGAQLMDDDRFGRLYDTNQWAHAFGPSHLPNPTALADSDSAKVWRAAGNSGNPCPGCGLITEYGLLVGTMIQQAGPTLAPLTVERGMVGAAYRRGGWDESRQNPTVRLTKFGPGDYTSASDYREVYWDPVARSTLDGNAGAYVPIDGGRRYEPGQLPGGLKVPATAQ